MITLDKLIRFNFIWGLIFTVVQGCNNGFISFVGETHIPYSLEEYKAHGGSTFDYYMGYAFVTSNNSVNHGKYDKYAHSITDRTVFRYLYLIFMFSFWVLGLYKLDYIADYREQQELKPEILKKRKRKFSPPNTWHYVLGITTTSMSVYGMYYTLVYIFFFWTK